MSPPLSTVDEVPAPASGIECRVWDRFACEVQASCQPVAARSDRDLHWPATLKDVSAKGLGVVLGRRFEPGAGLAIELPETDTRPADTLLARVVHVRPLGDGRWLLGCCLISELSPDEMEAIRGADPAQEAEPAPPEHVIPGVVVRWLGAGRGARPFRARRLFLTGRWPLAAGTVLRVRTGDAPAEAGWLRVKVHSCVQEGGRWTVTCAVLGRQPAGLLRTLGLPAPRR